MLCWVIFLINNLNEGVFNEIYETVIHIIAYVVPKKHSNNTCRG